MRNVRQLSVALAVISTTLVAGSAFAQSSAASAPGGLKAFLLRANESARHEFPRTPSFTWAPARGALRYEFQLAKSRNFTDGSIFWSVRGLRSPAVAPSIALPWMTGNPYAAYARVRAVTQRGLTAWSTPFGFNLRWPDVPKQLAGYAGLSRWTPVEGATGYEVWFTMIGPGWQKHVSTRTNAIDHREAYTFHDGVDWTQQVKWRVRAVRVVPKNSLVHVNGLPTVSYGPWSSEYTSINAPQGGALRAAAAVTFGATSKASAAQAHELTPAFAFSGREAVNNGPSGSYGLYRVYVTSDKDCVNVVFTGAVVGSPAYAPRTSGTLKLPAAVGKDLDDAFIEALDDGKESNTFMADLSPTTSTEQSAEEGASGSESSGSESSSSGSSGDAAAPAATVDLPESGWPNGRFYWTVVPVGVYVREESKIEYHDLVAPQDQCAAGNVVAFGKESSPVVAAQGAPFASGMSPSGRLIASRGARSVFYGPPIVAWLPVQGATEYEVQWSRSKYPWRAAGASKTTGTAAVLPLRPGGWWYRIRAINPFLPGATKAMAWSTPLHLSVARPRFAVAGS